MIRNAAATITAAVLLAAVLHVQRAAADIIVLESSVDAFVPGQVYADDVPVTLAEGESLSVVLPSGETKSVNGPLTGRVADVAKGAKLDNSVWATVTGILQRGAASEDQAGAVRSLGASPSSDAAMMADFSWTVVPAFVEGSFCVQKDAQLEISRPPLGDVDTMVIADPAAGANVPIRWPSDAETVAWPSQVPPAADKTYSFQVPSLPEKQVTLRFLEQPLPADTALLPTLIAKGCTFQVESWLMGKINGSTQ